MQTAVFEAGHHQPRNNIAVIKVEPSHTPQFVLEGEIGLGTDFPGNAKQFARRNRRDERGRARVRFTQNTTVSAFLELYWVPACTAIVISDHAKICRSNWADSRTSTPNVRPA